jgi:hypothetical protein
MQNVHVTHVGGNSIIPDAEFRTEDQGDLIVYRDREEVARFAATKWSAAIKMDAPQSVTR